MWCPKHNLFITLKGKPVNIFDKLQKMFATGCIFICSHQFALDCLTAKQNKCIMVYLDLIKSDLDGEMILVCFERYLIGGTWLELN